MKLCGIGCYKSKAKSLHQLVRAPLNLKTCTTDDLEKIHGIAEKTSRFFILHTREAQQIAALDRHILHYMRDEGVADVPHNTPKGRTYKRLEKEFLSLCQQQGKSAAELDLEVWYKYSKYKE
jgi:thermostable 8-oxoguanine DNA glycosylase